MSIFSNGNGYDGYSMSNNARDAYACGEKPLSKWTKTAILDRVRELIADDDVTPGVPVCKLADLKAQPLKDLLLRKTSWHHTSSMYNRTDFYDVDAMLLERLTYEDLKAAAAAVPAEKAAPAEERWECEFLEWSGTRKHPKATKHVETGTIRGGWFYRADGSKKKTTANGFRRIRKIA